MHRKANKQDVAEELKKIIRTTEFDQILQLIENKASIDDIERLEALLDDKTTQKDLNDIKNILENKAEKDDVEIIISKSLQNDKDINNKAIKDLKNKLSKSKDDMIEELKLIRQDLYQKLD